MRGKAGFSLLAVVGCVVVSSDWWIVEREAAPEATTTRHCVVAPCFVVVENFPVQFLHGINHARHAVKKGRVVDDKLYAVVDANPVNEAVTDEKAPSKQSGCMLDPFTLPHVSCKLLLQQTAMVATRSTSRTHPCRNIPDSVLVDSSESGVSHTFPTKGNEKGRAVQPIKDDKHYQPQHERLRRQASVWKSTLNQSQRPCTINSIDSSNNEQKKSINVDSTNIHEK